jgi:two-component system chemotaxis response regulator CheY
MEIFTFPQKDKLLERITLLRKDLPDWLMVKVKIKDAKRRVLSSDVIAEIMNELYRQHEGFVLICNEAEVLLVIRWGKENSPEALTMTVSKELPPESCDAIITPLTREGLQRMVLIITIPEGKTGVYHQNRMVRQENNFMIADDDMYIRALVKAGLKGAGGCVEIGNGSEVIEAYKKYNPDMLLLDIHLPGLTGQLILSRLISIDPAAYVIMLSADSSTENVQWAVEHGAKGFLPKPFSKTKLLEYAGRCPTVARLDEKVQPRATWQ